MNRHGRRGAVVERIGGQPPEALNAFIHKVRSVFGVDEAVAS